MKKDEINFLKQYEFFDKNAKDASVLIFNTEPCDNCKTPVICSNSISICFGTDLKQTIENLTIVGLKPAQIEANEWVVTDNGEYFCNACA